MRHRYLLQDCHFNSVAQNGERGIFVETLVVAGVSGQFCLKVRSGIGVYYFGDTRLVRVAARAGLRFGEINNLQRTEENSKVEDVLQCCLSTKTD
jgi:hypothetical protein